MPLPLRWSPQHRAVLPPWHDGQSFRADPPVKERHHIMNRWLYLLLLAVPVALIAEALHAPPLATFLLAALGLIPLAGLIGLSTEVLAERLGPRIGGLLNATFGNAAEIIIGLAALAAGLPEVVRASLAGSIIGNAL